MKTQVKFFLKQLFLVIVLFYGLSLNAQDKETKSFAVYPTFGFGIGFFYPSDVNDYIADAYSSYIITSGTTDIYMWLEGHAGLNFRIKILELSGFIEYAFAPKIAIQAGPSFSFNRFSPGLMANVHIPIGSGKHSFFLGAGPQYHMMKFEEYEADKIGFRIQAGMSMMFGKFNLQPFGAFNYAKAIADKKYQSREFDLNYTGGQIGLYLSFHSIVK